MATARGRHCKRPESDFCRWWGRHKVRFHPTPYLPHPHLYNNRINTCSPLYSPLISILSHLHQHPTFLPPFVQFLYTTRPMFSCGSPSILFLPRLRRLCNAARPIPTPLQSHRLDFSDADFPPGGPRETSPPPDSSSTADELHPHKDCKLQLFLTGTSLHPFADPSLSKTCLMRRCCHARW